MELQLDTGAWTASGRRTRGNGLPISEHEVVLPHFDDKVFEGRAQTKGHLR